LWLKKRLLFLIKKKEFEKNYKLKEEKLLKEKEKEIDNNFPKFLENYVKMKKTLRKTG